MKLKKLFSIILSALLLVTVIPLGAFTVSADTSGYYTYTVSDNKATITKVDKSISGDITIPDELGGYSVISIGNSSFRECTGLMSVRIPNSATSIGNNAFRKCTGLMSITIGNSVTSIGSCAFCDCTKLKSVTLFDSVTSIGYGAFEDCTRLAKITIPNSVTSIGGSAFSGCIWLTSVTIGDSVTSIGSCAFYNCISLTSVTIPDSVTSIGGSAFSNCCGLGRINVENENAVYHSSGNCLIVTEGKAIIAGCKNSVIPTDGSVTSIGEGAFSACTGLTSITIPDSVTRVGDRAFYGCTGLKDVFYKGTTQQKTGISIGSDNSPLYSAAWHCITNLNYKPATCTEPGYTGDIGWKGYDVFTYGEEIPALGHDYIAKIIEPTCTELGYTTYTCSHCGDSYTDSYTDELGHNYNSVIIEATYTAQGYTTHTCSRCGDSYKDSYTYMSCGENAGFIIENGTLYIHGAGETSNWKTQAVVPWYDYADKIKEVVIDEGITKIGTYAFYCLNNLESVICKNKDTEFGRYALDTDNENLTVYSQNGTLAGYCRDSRIQFVDITATPELDSFTANSITIKAVGGYEYSIDLANWQTSGTFSNLPPATKHNIYARLIKTKNVFPEEISAPLTVTTDKITVSAPVAPDYQSHTENSITVIGNPAYEYSLDAETWQTSPTFENLDNNVIYRIYARVAETETEYASAPSKPLIIALPSAPVACTNEDVITVKAIEGFEYCLDDMLWQDSPVFDKLIDNMDYTVYQRLKTVSDEKVYQIKSAPTTIITDSSLYGHNYNTAVTAPTCTEQGYTTYTCENCGDSYVDDYTEAAGHSAGAWASDETGHRHICTACGEKFDETEHTPGEWITDNEALPGIAGSKHKECTVCGYITETEEIPALPTYTPGDINGDDAVNNKDLTRLFQYLSDWDVEVDEAALDVNGDGSVNNKDLTRLFQYLSDWDVEIF